MDKLVKERDNREIRNLHIFIFIFISFSFSHKCLVCFILSSLRFKMKNMST